MKTTLLLLVLLTVTANSQGPVVSHEGSPVTVVSSRWVKDRQELVQSPEASVPAAAMIPQNKNFEKNRRANTSPGERDPNLDTIDGRSAALEKAVQQSRAAKPVDGFSYQAKIHNASGKPIEIIFWEYQFTDPGDAANLTRRQFLCGVSIKPEKDKELKAFTLMGPHNVISVDTLAKKTTASGEAKVVINRVEFADGSIWQRPDWSFGEIRLGYARAMATPWVEGACKVL
jgi:hypothetical protein